MITVQAPRVFSVNIGFPALSVTNTGAIKAQAFHLRKTWAQFVVKDIADKPVRIYLTPVKWVKAVCPFGHFNLGPHQCAIGSSPAAWGRPE